MLAEAATDLTDPRDREIKELRAEVARLQHANDALTRRVRDLLELIHRRIRPPKKDEPSPPPAPPDAASDDEKKAFKERPLPPEDEPKEEKQKPTERAKPTGRKQVSKHLPVDHVSSRCSCCAACGADLTDCPVVDTLITEQLDIVLELLRKRETRRQIVRCTCGHRNVPPRAPAPFPSAKLTCGALAQLVYFNIVLLIPLVRIAKWFSTSMRVEVSVGFLVDMRRRAAELLDGVEEAHWTELMNSPWLGVDGSPFETIVEGLAGTQKGYLEAFQNDDIVVFKFALNKLASTLYERLEGYAGIVIADLESRNLSAFERAKLLAFGCNAHLVRKFRDAAKEQPVLAAEASRYMKAIYALHRKSQRQDLQGAAMLAWRQSRIAPVYENLRIWATKVLPTLTLPSDALGSTLRYMLGHWGALTGWLHDERLAPPDNNGCERLFQPVAKARDAWLFFGSPQGGHRVATLMGVVATCQRIGVDPLAWLTWAFTRLGTAAGEYGTPPPEALTPSAYKRSLASS